MPIEKINFKIFGTTTNAALEFKTNSTFSGVIDPGITGSDGSVFFGVSAGNYGGGGINSVAIGYENLMSSTGTPNDAIGYETLTSNTSGSSNDALGYQAGYNNTTGSDNIFIGNSAGFNTTSGSGNTFVGFYAGHSNATIPHGGAGNTALGWDADIAAGVVNATAIGNGSDATASNSIVLGNNGVSQLDFYGSLSPYNSAIPGFDPGTAGYVLQSNGPGNSPSWVIPAGGGAAWQLVGNASTLYGTDFVGTTDNNNLMFEVDGTVAGRIEDATAPSATSSTSLGYGALNSNSGSNNSALGFNALSTNSGSDNDAFGFQALNSNSGSSNDAVGYQALFNNYTGDNNDAFGFEALYSNSRSGRHGTSNNCAFGSQSLYSNLGGSPNNAFGYLALYSNIYASQNTAIGTQALFTQDYNNTFASAAYITDNVAVGYQALYYNNPSNESGGIATDGNQNTAIGDLAGIYNSTGYSNTFLGYGTGGNDGTLGINQQTGTNNIFIGYNSTASADGYTNCSAMGNGAIVGGSNQMEFGTCSIIFTGLNGGVYASGDALVVGDIGCSSANGSGAYLTTGGTWTNVSSKSLKTDISTLNGRDILNKINELDVEKWRYKATNEYHIGPFAEQFYHLFNTGLDSTHISTVDPSGIALIGIKELSKELNSKDSSIAQQQQQITAQSQQLQNQQSQLDQLSAMVSKLDIALSQCCANYQSTSGTTQTGSSGNNTDAPLLNQNIPNPFSQNTIISCYVPSTAKGATISIFNLDGELLKSYTIPATGFNQITVPAGSLAASDYLYTLFVDGAKVDTKKMTLTR